jgi:hypothetical protein
MNKYILIVALAISSVTVKASTTEVICEKLGEFAHATTIVRHKEGMTLSKHLDRLGKEVESEINSVWQANAYKMLVAIVEDIYAEPKSNNPKLAAKLYKYEVISVCLEAMGE